MSLYFGVDIGSTGIKVGAFTELGAPLRDGSGNPVCATAKVETFYPQPGWVEQDPERWWDGFQKASRQLVEKLELSHGKKVELAAVALSGQMQNVILVDSSTKLTLQRTILYSDTRAKEESRELESLLGGVRRIAGISGNYKGPSSCLCKLLWCTRNLRETSEKATHVLFGAHSYIAWRLTGVSACDYTTANTTSLLDIAGKDGASDKVCWAKQRLLIPGGLKSWVDKMPKLLDTAMSRPIGKVSLSELTGASHRTDRTIQIFHGCGDLGTTTIGASRIATLAGIPTERDIYMYVGTSGWIATTEECSTPPEMQEGVFAILHPKPSRRIFAAS